MACEAEAVDELARELFVADNATLSVLPDRVLSRWWAAEDESTRLFYRREAARKLQEAATRERV